MKVQVIYSSLSGCTRKLADAVFQGIAAEEKSIHNLKDGKPKLDGDVILVGYWVDQGGPCKEIRELLPEIKGKAVGLFCTLGYYADSAYARTTLDKGLELLNKNNTVIGNFICNGALSQAVIDGYRKSPQGASPSNELRWEIMKDHPTAAECTLAAERFRERITLWDNHRKNHIEFSSVI